MSDVEFVPLTEFSDNDLEMVAVGLHERTSEEAVRNYLRSLALAAEVADFSDTPERALQVLKDARADMAAERQVHLAATRGGEYIGKASVLGAGVVVRQRFRYPPLPQRTVHNATYLSIPIAQYSQRMAVWTDDTPRERHQSSVFDPLEPYECLLKKARASRNITDLHVLELSRDGMIGSVGQMLQAEGATTDFHPGRYVDTQGEGSWLTAPLTMIHTLSVRSRHELSGHTFPTIRNPEQ